MSWEQLIAITKEVRQIAEEDKRKPLLDCPNCGWPLEVNAKGVKNCPMGDFRTQ
jgi:hypothetical protein